MMRAHLAQRFADEERVSALRAERLRAAVPGLARSLVARGASRVVLFGSLAPGGRPRRESDVDLCVEGLSASSFREAASACLDALGDATVDLVRWEDAGPALRAEIAHGLEVARVSR
jgi:predicted nucleotidyltransferase